MSEVLLSVGLDVGTTSSQMVLSELTVENRAGSLAVPEMEIAQRKILYKCPIDFTPLLVGDRVDGEKLREIVDSEYEKAGIRKPEVDTGAIIITGETSRKENARTVLEQLSGYAGDFVVATAGPDLESVLAAKGAGAVEYGEKTGKKVLHMDIGGGTSNLALIEDGVITATACLNVGGRLLKIRPDGCLSYVSPVLEGIFGKKTEDYVNREEVLALARKLVQALEAAAGLREKESWMAGLKTADSGVLEPPEGAVISFSGGVADCIGKDFPWDAFGDLGPVLGQAIRETLLCRNPYDLGEETIRATVIGAGCHSAMLSGSTVFMRNIALPRKGLAAVPIESPEDIPAALKACDDAPIFCITAPSSYRALRALAREIAGKLSGREMLLCMESDAAKALGQAIALEAPQAGILCIDRIRAEAGSFLDVGAPVGPALPVIVKTLILER